MWSSKQSKFYIASKLKKDTLSFFYMSDAFCLKNYWGWYHKKQKVKGFDLFKKSKKVLIQNLFGDDIFVVHNTK